MPGFGTSGRSGAARAGGWALGAAGCVAMVLFMPLPAAAGAGAWTPIGPDAGIVTGLAADPEVPRTLFAVTSISGLFKTSDGGDSWVPADQGIDLGQAFLVTVAAAPDGTLLAGGYNGVWRSLDGGASWRQSPPVLFFAGLRFAFDPRQAHVVHVASVGGVYRSADGGVSWKAELLLPIALPGVFHTVAVAPESSATVIAGGDAGLYRSGDGGGSWRRVLGSCAAQDLAFDAARPGRVYAACGLATSGPAARRFGVMTSADGGITWAATRLGGFPVSSLAVVAGAPESLLAGTSEGIFVTADGGARWTELHGLGAVNVLAVDPHAHSMLYAGLPGQGVFHSADRGASWTAANGGLSGELVRTLAANPGAGGQLYIGTFGLGVWFTTDAGAGWETLDRGLTNLDVESLAVALPAPSTLYARGGQTDVFVSTDSGRSWQKRSPPASLGLLFAGPVVDPADPQHILVAGSQGAVGSSRDGGATWQTVALAPGSNLTSLVFAPSAPQIVYAASAAGKVSGGAFKSTDGGVTWTPLDLQFPVVGVLAVDPQDFDTVYAASAAAVFKTVDGGGTWSRAGPFPGVITALTLDVRLPGVLIAATEGSDATSVWISRDAGASWSPLAAGLPAQLGAWAVVFDAASAATLYAATGFGVYELTCVAPGCG